MHVEGCLEASDELRTECPKYAADLSGPSPVATSLVSCAVAQYESMLPQINHSGHTNCHRIYMLCVLFPSILTEREQYSWVTVGVSGRAGLPAPAGASCQKRPNSPRSKAAEPALKHCLSRK